MGRAGLINSRRRVAGESDLADAVRTAVINKRAGGMGLISRPQGVPAADGRGRRAAERDPGRLPVARGHGRLTDPLVASEGWGVIHCYFRLRGYDSNANVVAADIERMAEELCAEAPATRRSGPLRSATAPTSG